MTNESDCCGDLTYTQPIQKIDEETELLEWTYIRKCSKCNEPCGVKEDDNDKG